MMLISLGLGLVVALLLIGVVTAFTSSSTTTTLLPTTLVGTTLPAFHEPGLHGGTVRAPWAEGHPTVVVFFASFCAPCHEELPRVASVVGAGALDNVRVIGVDANDVLSAGQAFATKAGVRFPVVFDANGSLTSGTFGFESLPETVFVSARGVVREVLFGAVSTHDLLAGVTALR